MRPSEERFVPFQKELQSFVDARLLAILIKRKPTDVPDMGTGILFQLHGRYFFLTAGHVARDVLSRGDKTLSCPLAGHPTKFRPVVHRAGYLRSIDRDENTGIDAGYIEIPGHDANTIQAIPNYVFQSPRSVEVVTRDQLLASKDPLVIAGYPFAHSKQVAPHGTGVSLQFFFVIPSETPTATWTPQGCLGNHVVHVGMPAEQEPISSFVTGVEAFVPKLQGVSGGGCWAAHADHLDWSPDAMRLVAVHAGTVPGPAGAEPPRWAREVLVGYHLRKIADDYPDLADHVFRLWPGLAGSEWADPDV